MDKLKPIDESSPFDTAESKDNEVESKEKEPEQITIESLAAEIKDLKNQLVEKDKKHAAEIKEIVTSFTGQKETKKTEFEQQVDEVSARINKYRGGNK